MTHARPVDVVSAPFAGHLHPHLAIARALRTRGVPVRVVTAASAEQDVRAAGFEPHLVGVHADREVVDIVNTERPIRSNPVRLARQLRRQLAVADAVRTELAALYAAAPPAVALVDSVMPFAGVVARAHGARWFTVATSPCAIETAEGPPSYVAGLRPGGPLARARDSLLRTNVRAFKRLMFTLNRGTAHRMGIDRVYRTDGSESVYSDDATFALGLAQFELTDTFPARVRFVGPARYTPPRDDDPPPMGPGRTVLITLGTHVPFAKAAMLDAARRTAAALPGVAFVFSLGDRAAPARHEGNLRVLPWVSYDHLGRFDLVVHHGGSGVLGAAMLAGVPAVVHPVDYDQFDMAARLEVHGLAREVRDLGDLPQVVAEELAAPTAIPAALERFQQLARDHDGAAAVAEAVVRALAETR